MLVKSFLDEGQKGSVGIVFRAIDELDREVAVKFFDSPIGPIRDFVARHAQSLARINDENVVKIFGIADVKRPDRDQNAEPEPALIMEYAPGQKFSDWLNKPSLTRTEVLSVVSGLLKGLGAFHRANLAHGDLHSGNVHVLNGIAKIVDPIARDPNHALTTAETRERQLADLSFVKRLILDALRAGNANTQAFGEFCIMRTDIATIPQLSSQVELALKDPLADVTVQAAPSISSFYDFCREAQRSNNYIAWQEAKKAGLRSLQPNLNEWRQKAHRLPDDPDLLNPMFAQVLLSAGDFLSFLLASAESGRPEDRADLSIIRRLPTLDLERSGETRFVGIPDAILFCSHYFVGATACWTGNLEAAFAVSGLRLKSRYRENRVRLWEERKWTGWVDTFRGNCKESFKFLMRAYGLLPMLRQVFPDEFSYRVAIGSYNWLLACVELVNMDPTKLKTSGESELIRSLYRPTVPPNFLRLTTAEIGEACDVLFADGRLTDKLLALGKFGLEDLRRFWTPWLHGSLRLWGEEAFDFHDIPNYVFEVFKE